jgi:hypothetical protein
VVDYLQLLGLTLGFRAEEMQLRAHKVKAKEPSWAKRGSDQPVIPRGWPPRSETLGERKRAMCWGWAKVSWLSPGRLGRRPSANEKKVS